MKKELSTVYNRYVLEKQLLEFHYSSGRSMKEISQILGSPTNTVVYWMKKHNIKRRSLSEAIYAKSNPDGDPFQIKINFSKRDTFLLGLGLGIFWGEGTKVSKTSVRVTNTNPRMLLQFISFLRLICRVKESKIRYSLVCFNNSSVNKAKKYWSKELQIPTSKFGKIVQIPSQGKGTYKKKSKYGVCTISVHNLKLKSWIDEQLIKL